MDGGGRVARVEVLYMVRKGPEERADVPGIVGEYRGGKVDEKRR